MSSEKLGHNNNVLKGDLGGGFDILTGSTGEQTDLGVARRFGAASAAYSLRDIGAMNGRVVKVRRDVDGDGTDKEEDFSANQVQSGALEDWVNGKLESTLPADVATAAAAYSLRKVKASYSGDAVRIRRSSDGVEVDVAFDSDDKVSASSAITNVAEQGGESGSTTATDLNGFLNEILTVGTAVNGTSGVDNYNLTNVSNTGFSADNSAGGTGSAGFPYAFANGDVIVVKYTVSNFSSTSSLSPAIRGVTNTNNVTTIASGGTTFTANGTYTDTLTATADGTHLMFADSNTGSYTISDFEIVSHTHQASVYTWYDQAGSNDAVQFTAANQPQIAESGALLDGIKFNAATDGTSPDFLQAVTRLGVTTDHFVSVVFNGYQTDSSAFGAFLNTRNGNAGFQYGISVADTVQAFFYAGAGNNANSSSNFTLSNNSPKRLVTFDKDGNNLTGFGNATTNGISLSNGVNTPSTIITNIGVGGNVGTTTSLGLRANINELIVHETDQADNRFKIESNINNYYGLYTFQGDGFVETWYDQSGNGNDATQATAGNQPAIVQNGSISKSNGSPSIFFTGDTRDDELDFTDLTLTNATIFTVVNIDSSADQQILLGGSSSTSTGTMIPMMDNGSSTTQVYKNATVGGAEQGSSQFKNGSQITLADRDDAFDNLAVDSQILFTMVDVDVAEAKVLDGISRTPSDALTFHLQGKMNELIIYNSDLSSDRGTIESEIANHYNITLS